jgi:tetrapyrrole methylase family protein/MazG family protein
MSPSFSPGVQGLIELVDRLLGPEGCPWDQEQTHASLKKFLLEETYEVLDAIDSGDSDRLRDELGDLLLQPIMHAQMEKRDGAWDIHEVAERVTEKLIRRHPHVFGDERYADADEVLRNWDRLKQQEKDGPPPSILAGIPRSTPGLARAYELSRRAARVGFEWPDREAVVAKLREEEAELEEAIARGDQAAVEAEMGDMLFTLVNVSRWLRVDPEDALRRMLDRFTERFQRMEAAATAPLGELTPEEWDRLWNDAKRAERG